LVGVPLFSLWLLNISFYYAFCSGPVRLSFANFHAVRNLAYSRDNFSSTVLPLPIFLPSRWAERGSCWLFSSRTPEGGSPLVLFSLAPLFWLIGLINHPLPPPAYLSQWPSFEPSSRIGRYFPFLRSQLSFGAQAKSFLSSLVPCSGDTLAIFRQFFFAPSGRVLPRLTGHHVFYPLFGKRWLCVPYDPHCLVLRLRSFLVDRALLLRFP